MTEKRSERHQARLAVVEEKIRSGEIADPETLERPTAAEIAGALHDLNTGRGDRAEAVALLSDVPNHALDKVDGRFVLVRGAETSPGVFAPPTAVVEQAQE